MTNEEKQSFFTQYYGTRTAFSDGFIRTIGMTCDVSDIDHLELRTIDLLTNEELVELSKICWKENELHSSECGKCIVDWIKHTNGVLLKGKTQPTYDYLRSIGVLVGFRNFTPEMLIAEGVVKIKD
jgi:hypothetical protein